MSTNLEKIRAAAETWAASRGRNTDVWLDLAAEDIELYSAAEGREPAGFTRQRRGKPGFAAYCEAMRTGFELRELHIDELFGTEEIVTMLTRSRWTVHATGKPMRQRGISIFTFEQGRIARFESFLDTTALFEALTPARRKHIVKSPA